MLKLMYLTGYTVKHVVVNLNGFSFRIHEHLHLKDGTTFRVNVFIKRFIMSLKWRSHIPYPLRNFVSLSQGPP